MSRKSDPKRVQYGSEEYNGVVVGRFNIIINPEEIHKLATYHCTIPEMCDFYGVQRDTLLYHFEDLIKAGYESTKQKLRGKQIEVALSGNPTMLIWLGKNMLGQSENGSLTSIEDSETEATFKVIRPAKPIHTEEATDES